MSGRMFSSCVTKPVRLLLLAALILLGIPQAYAQELLKVYYVRHAEGGHNVVKEWKDKPKEQTDGSFKLKILNGKPYTE